MKTLTPCLGLGWALLGVALGCAPAPLTAADLELTAFGLRHTVVSNAYLSTPSSRGLIISQSSVAGSSSSGGSGLTIPFAIDIDLGRAESGVFIYPNKSDPMNGQSLEGWAFGERRDGDGTIEILAGVKGRRIDWGQYEGVVDYAPLGATQYRFELYCDQYLIAEAAESMIEQAPSRLPGSFLVDTISIEAYDPRINPLQRLPDGRLAAVVELPSPTLFTVEGAFSAGGTRLLIIPEDLTNDVAHVSRVRMIGNNGLPEYEIQDERLVFFGAPHRALGSAVYAGHPHGFTMTEVDTPFDAGILIEGGHTSFLSASLTDTILDQPGQHLSMGLAGTSSGDPNGTFLGPFGLTYEQEAWGLFFGDVSFTADTYRLILDASINGVPSGHEEVETQFILGSFSADSLRPIRMGGFGVMHTNRGGLFLTLAEPTTLTTINSNQITGDTFYVSLINQEERLGAVTSLSLLARNMDGFTVTNETRIPLPPEPLTVSIARLNADYINVTSPYFPCHCYSLNTATNLAPVSGYLGESSVYDDFKISTIIDSRVSPEGYFWLRYRYGHFGFFP